MTLSYLWYLLLHVHYIFSHTFWDGCDVLRLFLIYKYLLLGGGVFIITSLLYTLIYVCSFIYLWQYSHARRETNHREHIGNVNSRRHTISLSMSNDDEGAQLHQFAIYHDLSNDFGYTTDSSMERLCEISPPLTVTITTRLRLC